jgi:multiple sugar transport system substrate-binding protein
MVEAAVALTGNGVYGWAAPMSIDYLTLHNFMSVYLSYGARLLNDAGQCGLDTPEFHEAVSTYVSVYERDATHPDAATMTGDQFRRGFLDGRFAMIVDQPGIWSDLQREGAPFFDHVAVTHVPAGPEGRFGFLGGWPLVLWAQSDVKDAAARWILFATRPEGALRQLSITSGMIPGSSQLAQTDPWDEYPFTVFVEQLGFAYPYQYPDQAIAQMGQLEVNAIQTAIQAVALGQRTVEQATTDLCRRINDVLGR